MKPVLDTAGDPDDTFIDLVVKIAAHLFAERGYEGTSIRDISQATQVSIPVLYRHFGSKEDLYNFVCGQKFEEVYQSVTERLNAIAVDQRDAGNMALVVFDVLIENPDLYYLINRNMVNTQPARACAADLRLYMKLREIIDRTLGFSKDAEHGETLSYSFDAVVSGFASLALASNVTASREEHVRRCRDNLKWFVTRSLSQTARKPDRIP